MADISKITLPNGDEYDIKDATARSSYVPNTGGTFSGGVTFSGGITYHSLTMPAILIGTADPSTVINQLQDGDIYIQLQS